MEKMLQPKIEKDTVILTATVQGAHNIDKENSLRFNIDGEFYDFSSIDSMTDIKTEYGSYSTNWSSRRYIVKTDFLEKLINAKEVWVKINLAKTYVEGKFSADNPTAARPAFRKFYERISD